MISKNYMRFVELPDYALDMRVSIFSIGFWDLPSGGPCALNYFTLKRVCMTARILCELATITIFDLFPHL